MGIKADKTINLKKGSRYKFTGSVAVIIFLGHKYDSSGYWYQFALEETPDEVWSELKASDLFLLEEVS